MSGEPVTVLIRYQAQPGKEEAALAVLEDLVAIVVREEPDCLGITILSYVSDPTRILLDERWTSREAYLGPHLDTPHLRAFVERAMTLFTDAPEITFWETRAEARRS